MNQNKITASSQNKLSGKKTPSDHKMPLLPRCKVIYLEFNEEPIRAVSVPHVHACIPLAFYHLRQLPFQVRIVNIRPDEIVDGNPKLTLGLIWIIILHFHVSAHFRCFSFMYLLSLSAQIRQVIPFIKTIHFLSFQSDVCHLSS